MSTFDPAAWIREFRAVGGSYALSADGKRLSVQQKFMGVPRADQDEASRLARLLDDPDRLAGNGGGADCQSERGTAGR